MLDMYTGNGTKKKMHFRLLEHIEVLSLSINTIHFSDHFWKEISSNLLYVEQPSAL